jgi:hypothetical protein
MNSVFWTIAVCKGYGVALASHLMKTMGAHDGYVSRTLTNSLNEVLSIWIPAHEEEAFLKIVENDPNVISY